MRTSECPTFRFAGNVLTLGTFASLLISVSGCSTADSAAAVAPPPGESTGTEQTHVAIARKPAAEETRKLAHNRTTTVATVEPDGLLGLSPQEVLQRLGPPAHERKDSLSREWVYAAPGCRFRIFFYPNVDLTSFKVLKYSSKTRSGQQIGDSRMCVREILTARNTDEHS